MRPAMFAFLYALSLFTAPVSAQEATATPALQPPPLPPLVEVGREQARIAEAKRDADREYRDFLQKCGKIRDNAMSHVNHISVVQYTGEYKEWRSISPAGGGRVVDFYFNPIQILQGANDDRIVISQHLANARILNQSEEGFIASRYNQNTLYLLLSERSAHNDKWIEFDSEGVPYSRSVVHRPIEMIPLSKNKEQ